LGNDDVQVVVPPVQMAADMRQHLGHQGDIEDVRDVRQSVASGGEESGCHLLQHCVLGAEDADRAAERLPSLDDDLGHPAAVYGLPPGRRSRKDLDTRGELAGGSLSRCASPWPLTTPVTNSKSIWPSGSPRRDTPSTTSGPTPPTRWTTRTSRLPPPVRSSMAAPTGRSWSAAQAPERA